MPRTRLREGYPWYEYNSMFPLGVERRIGFIDGPWIYGIWFARTKARGGNLPLEAAPVELFWYKRLQ